MRVIRPIPWWLFIKELRDMTVARATLLVGIAAGPLVGHAFITAVDTYAEASGSKGGPAALSQGLSPLDGIVVPTWGAYALIVALLFPFMAIRAVSADKESGALALMLQSRASAGAIVIAKFKVLLTLWMALWLPGLAALALWKVYGGHLDAGEVLTVIAGHLLRGALTAAAAMAVAAITDGAATAAVVTLALTLGTWALDFVASIKGGLYERMAAFTPDAALRTFEHGELSLALVGVSLALTTALLVLCWTWLHPGRSVASRWRLSMLTAVVSAAACVGLSLSRTTWDASEDRRNSFSAADERALRTMSAPLDVTVHLAPEDPRLADLERGVLHKLRRTVPHMTVHHVARGATGLFEGRAGKGDDSYGEVWYQVGSRRVMSRSSIEEVVLSTVYDVAGITPPKASDDAPYPGFPLAHDASGAAVLLYAVWPVTVIFLWLWNRRRRRSR